MALALVVPSLARAGDKSQTTMVNPVLLTGTAFSALLGPVGPAFVNGTSKGKTKGDVKCRIRIQLAKLAGLPSSDQTPGTGDEVICITHAHVNVDPGGVNLLTDTSTVLRGEVKNGGVKIKVDLAAEATGCVPEKSAFPLAQFGSELTCYEPDPFFVPVSACAAATGTWIPFASDPTSGVCTWVPPSGSFLAPPGSPVIATGGIFFRP